LAPDAKGRIYDTLKRPIGHISAHYDPARSGISEEEFDVTHMPDGLGPRREMDIHKSERPEFGLPSK
jgi:hypothetical protein